jgi:ClpP class serine protease
MGPSLDFASRLFNAPVGLRETSRELAIGMLADWSAGVRAGRNLSALADFEASDTWGPSVQTVSRVAVIPIKGVLIQRLGPWWYYGDMLGVGGYDVIRWQVMQALADPKIDAIVLDVDSPGGEVAGCFDLADTIYQGRQVKPIAAILGENAYSAAYALASAAETISVPRTGGTGSVGVIYMHVSIEEALKKAGFAVTLITKGALKGDASEFTALSDEAYARIKADVLEVGALFDATVARNRGMDVKDVTATQAGTFLGAAGVDIGFADEVLSPDAAFRALLNELG